jgi:hypothetical protein
MLLLIEENKVKEEAITSILAHDWEGTPKRSQERTGDVVHCGEETQSYPYKYFDG